MQLRWPLIGRDGELDAVRRLLGEARAGGLVLAGPAGVGRSRLLRAAVEEAARTGYRTEFVAATRAGSSVPFGAVSHLLPPGYRVPPFPLVAHRLRLDGRRVLVAVDDAHLLDEASAALVHFLAVHGLATTILTVTVGRPAPDAVVALWKDGIAPRREVRPLADEAVGRLLDRSLAGGLCGPAEAKLRGLSDGRPLYLRELLTDAVDLGVLHQRYGVWCWSGTLRGAGRLAELVAARLDGLAPDVRTAVELVAVGEPGPLCAAVPGQCLGAAEQAGLLEVTDDDAGHPAVQLADPLVGEVLRVNLPRTVAAGLYRTLVERQCRHRTPNRPDTARVASWRLAAGLPVPPSALVAAARQAAARFDLTLAERLARPAAQAGDPTAVRLLADVLRWQGRGRDSVQLLAAGPPPRVQPAEATQWQVSYIAGLYFGSARRAEAAEKLRALPRTPAAAALTAMILLFDGECVRARDQALPLLDDERVPVASRLWAYTAATCACALLGRTGYALNLSTRGLALAERCGDEALFGAYHLRIGRGTALALAGRLAEAYEEAERGYRRVVTGGDPAATAAWAALRALVAQVRGDLPTAVAALREAVAIEEEHDAVGTLPVRLSALAAATAMTGDVAQAQSWLRRADALSSGVSRLWVSYVELNRARVEAAAGRLRDAAETAIGAAGLARASGQVCVEAAALYQAAVTGAAGRVHRRLGELAHHTDSALVAAYARAGAALAARDGTGLEKAAAVFADLGAPLLASGIAVEASRVHRAGRRPQRANSVLEWARQLAVRCRGTGVPVPDSGEHEAALTQREREIALLAAAPTTSAEIARRLGLSVRTVNNHLGRVYAKLGISGRTQLGVVFGTRRVDPAAVP